MEYPSQDRLRDRVSLGTSMEFLLVNLMKSYDVSEAYPTVGPANNGPMIRNEEHGHIYYRSSLKDASNLGSFHMGLV